MSKNTEWFEQGKAENVDKAIEGTLWLKSKYFGFATCPFCGSHYRADIIAEMHYDVCPTCGKNLQKGDGK